MTRRTVALMVNSGKLTARTLAHVLQAAARKIQQEHNKPPHGKQTVKKLMGQGEAVNSIPVEAPKDFDRVARRWNVDYAFYKTGEGKYLLFFKSKQTDAITACFSEYSRRVVNRHRDRRIPILDQLEQASDRVRQQPHREHSRQEVAREDR